VSRPRTRANNEPIQLLTVCRLDRAKGVDVALRAIVLLRARGVAAHLEVIGDGPHRAALETESVALDVQSSVTFSGWRTQTEVYAAYRTADIFVLPTMREAQGVVLQEAMLHGLPVIASNTGGVPESLNFGDAGRLIPKNDADALAQAILELDANPDATNAMVHRAVDYTRARYTKAAVCRAHEALYANVLSANGAMRAQVASSSGAD
jgi:glycosyltransferase involved in cell wall biosynthesis